MVLIAGRRTWQASKKDEKAENHIEIWKIKQLIKNLQAARGNGTSMISLIIPPKDQISRVNKMLGDEYGTASNIKSRVNRLSVLSAITSTQAKLKLYTRVRARRGLPCSRLPFPCSFGSSLRSSSLPCPA